MIEKLKETIENMVYYGAKYTDFCGIIVTVNDLKEIVSIMETTEKEVERKLKKEISENEIENAYIRMEYALSGIKYRR